MRKNGLIMILAAGLVAVSGTGLEAQARKDSLKDLKSNLQDMKQDLKKSGDALRQNLGGTPTASTTAESGAPEPGTTGALDAAINQTVSDALGSAVDPNAQGVFDNHKNVTFEGKGQNFSIAGNHNDVIITGESGIVTVSGNHNKVTLDAAAKIMALGNHNVVTFKSGKGAEKPDIQNLGNANAVNPAGK